MPWLGIEPVTSWSWFGVQHATFSVSYYICFLGWWTCVLLLWFVAVLICSFMTGLKCYCCDAVSGGVLDTPANGPAPLPWDIQVSPPEKFQNATVHVEVPHTASVKVCLPQKLTVCFQQWINTHPFNGPFSGTTLVNQCQKGKTNLDFTEARDSEWQWHQLGRMQVCTSLQTDNHASTPPLSSELTS